MTVLENSIQISAPKDKVWGAIADLDVYAQWMTLHVDFPEGTPDEMKQGETALAKTGGHELGQGQVVITQVPGDGVLSRPEQDLPEERQHFQQQHRVGPKESQ